MDYHTINFMNIAIQWTPLRSPAWWIHIVWVESIASPCWTTNGATGSTWSSMVIPTPSHGGGRNQKSEIDILPCPKIPKTKQTPEKSEKCCIPKRQIVFQPYIFRCYGSLREGSFVDLRNALEPMISFEGSTHKKGEGGTDTKILVPLGV